MTHIVSRQPWATVDIDTAAGRVFFQQTWQYTWILFSPTVPAWTQRERQDFHSALDRQIWGTWSNRVRLAVAGTSDFAKRFAGIGVPINFDVRWVTAAGNWNVSVRKMPAGSSPTTFISNVNFSARRIELDTADLSSYNAANAAGASTGKFFAGPHEFGHALRAGDEYGAGSANLADTNSIMNVGRQVRSRHLQQVVTLLNTMIPNTTFSAPTVIP
jgi:hypothetical protein